VRGELMPVDMRMPGYPAFLAVVYWIVGRTRNAVMLVQAAIDLITCVLAALISASIVPRWASADKKSRVATIAVWIAVLCPFTASYTAAVLTETLASFFTTLTLLVLVRAVTNSALDPASGRSADTLDRKTVTTTFRAFLLAGMIAGLGALVRPETPLVLAAAGVVISVRWRHLADWPKVALAALSMAVGLLAVLTPWATRNARTMGRIEFLAPRYAESAGDYMPCGLYAWTRTWMVRYRDAYSVTWAVGNKAIEIDALPGGAFDSDAERARVRSLLASYNGDLRMTPSLDRQFGALARERSAAHPLRTFVWVPVARAFVMWFTPRVDVLRYSGKLWPPGEQWSAKPVEFCVTLIFGLLNFVYVGLALVGAWRYRRNPGVALVVSYLLFRTGLLTQLPTVEPRYVVICFPVVIALDALAFLKAKHDVSLAEPNNLVTVSAA
jgi:4-amino-4-deoxy-L-arabinose transferase-like glycosyltransferase